MKYSLSGKSLRFKSLFVLSIIFFLTFAISVSVSTYILLSNQNRNIQTFKNEFINTFTENAADTAKTAAGGFSRLISGNRFGSAAVADFCSKGDNGNLVLLDHMGGVLSSSPDFPGTQRSIMPDDAFTAMVRSNTIGEKKEFRIDNFNTFLNESSTETIPSIIHFKVFENPHIILGVAKTSVLTSVRIRYIERMNRTELSKSIIIYTAAFFIFFTAVYALLITFIRRTLLYPVSKISDQIVNVINGDYRQRVETSSGDEIGKLGASFNTMSEKIEHTMAELKKEIIVRENAERLLSEEKEELNVTLRSIGDGVITAGKDGRVILINKAAERLTGWKHHEAEGLFLEDIFRLTHEFSGAAVSNPAYSIINFSEADTGIQRALLLSKNGTSTLIESSASPIYKSDSEISGAVLAFRDITEQKKTEENNLRTIKLESIGFLAGGIAHDFNNILAAILGNISFAKTFLPETDKTHSLIENAEKAAYRAKDISNQLLSLSKGGSPVTTVASIRELLTDAVKFALHGSNIECVFSIQDKIWNALCDEGQIVQVIHNCIINARQAMPSGGKIYISCTNYTALDSGKDAPLSPGEFLKISIEDTGCGISPEHISKIFDPYFTTKQEGQGIGLTMTYSIIKKHKGRIDVSSEKGKGACFTFYLPATSSAPSKSLPRTGKYTGRKLSVLILEDDQNIIDILKTYFTHNGHETDMTNNGNITVQLYKDAFERKRKYDLVILDLTIKNGMGGKETIAELLAIDPDIKAVVSSGYSNDSAIAKHRELGFSARLVKPFTTDDINMILCDFFE